MSTKTAFKAPQKTLQSSWVKIVYTKPKQLTVIKRSLSNRATPMIKDKGMMASNSFEFNNSY